MKTPNTPHDIAKQLAEKYKTLQALSEADTRHQIIDSILHDVLSWPRASVTCEPYIDPGYADYVLLGHSESQLLFVEAKKEGISFELPNRYVHSHDAQFIKIATLMTDENISAALLQVQNYCINSGCEYAAITNGHQWIIFKTFERHADWRTLQAIVIPSLSYFDEHFTKAINLFGYSAITEHASLCNTLGGAHSQRRAIFHPKSRVPEYNHEIHQNYLATCLRPLAERYLGVMSANDDKFMEQCYVSVRDYHASITGVTQIIRDCLTPYFKNYNVREFFDDGRGGELGKRIASNLRERKTREVVILFGGKGSGKSTFIKKLLYHRPPKELRENATIAVVDLIECPEDKQQIENETARQLIAELDKDHVLQTDRDSLLSTLFSDRYELARKQTLAGLNPQGDVYNSQLNILFSEWLKDWQYCAVRLADYWKKKQRGTIVILDNTDQYAPAMQDYCFTLAQQIASLVDGLVVIAMREERFYESKLHGTLDAFQNNGFHLSSPPAQFVFVKRLGYMLRILDDINVAQKTSPSLSATTNNDAKQLFRMLIGEFRRRNSHLSQFLRACSHGNMRLSLDMFRQFLLSGYTKVDEMISTGGWTLQIHQVLRPMMIPNRLFYDESLSSIPNAYQVRSDTTGSHFTALRILDYASAGMSPLNPSFIPISRLKGLFASRYNMMDDFCRNIDKFLRVGVLEANNRLDQYSDAVDMIKITPYGYYLKDTLSGMFSYLDLVCLDCGIHDEGVAHSLANMAKEEFSLLFNGKRGERIELRLNRVALFINYLCQEAEKERDLYALEPHEVRYATELKTQFEKESAHVRSSASRYVKRDAPREFTIGDLWD